MSARSLFVDEARSRDFCITEVSIAKLLAFSSVSSGLLWVAILAVL